MSVYYETGIQFPVNWRYTVEVCADNGYGYKIGEYEQLDLDIVRAELTEVRNGTREPEAHHKQLIVEGDLIEKREDAEPQWWMDNLIDHLSEVNSALEITG